MKRDSNSFCLQICGTGSGVGKSVIVTALCRIFLQDGFSVCPFKAQNMSLNSFVAKTGGEMGRAQAVQAQSARIEPHTDMNPILIKPVTDIGAQIILQGLPIANMTAAGYIKYKSRALKSVKESFHRLRNKYEAVVIEGAGSPAEINLKSHDIVNMKMAEIADAPVILAGDIDKGGVFASFVGTLELLDAKDRKRIKGFIINKFRGDKALLKGGIRFLERKTKRPVLGVIPYFRDIRIPEEDSVPLEKNSSFATHHSSLITYNSSLTVSISISVIMLPHMSNFTDFDALENEPDVKLHYVKNVCELNSPDVIIIPGTKNTIADLQYLKKSGFADKIKSQIASRKSGILIGICGGYQMLGKKIRDFTGVESKAGEGEGLGFLPMLTDFKSEKILSQVKAKEIASGLEITGYEIHHGRSRIFGKSRPVFRITSRHGRPTDGIDGQIAEKGRAWGTYIHGVFDEDGFRRNFLNKIRIEKRQAPLPQPVVFNLDGEFDKLAMLVRENLDMDLFYKILLKR